MKNRGGAVTAIATLFICAGLATQARAQNPSPATGTGSKEKVVMAHAGGTFDVRVTPEDLCGRRARVRKPEQQACLPRRRHRGCLATHGEFPQQNPEAMRACREPAPANGLPLVG